nr:polymeric immunoglobulin receptor-like [Misgurnus anguillicaudatus]
MKICLYLLFMLHFTAGKTCTDPQTTVKKFTWRRGPSWINVLQDKNYTGRLKLFNESSPTNLSLLISDLRKQDEGEYRCAVSSTEFRHFKITIKGCDLVNNTQTVEVIGRSGESVVLPCYCKELKTKPQQLTWTYSSLTQSNTTPEEIYPSEQSHGGKIKLLNKSSPGNLSLRLSDLTTKHEGNYKCSVKSQQYINIRLKVEEQTINSQTHQTTLQNPYVFALTSVFSLLLLTVLAVMIWKCRETRDVENGTSDGLVLYNVDEKKDVLKPESSAQDQHNKQDETEDEVTYSTVVHVKNAAKPAQKQIITAECSEYACLK